MGCKVSTWIILFVEQKFIECLPCVKHYSSNRDLAMNKSQFLNSRPAQARGEGKQASQEAVMTQHGKSFNGEAFWCSRTSQAKCFFRMCCQRMLSKGSHIHAEIWRIATLKREKRMRKERSIPVKQMSLFKGPEMGEQIIWNSVWF